MNQRPTLDTDHTVGHYYLRQFSMGFSTLQDSASHGLYYHVSGTTLESYLEKSSLFPTKLPNLVIFGFHVHLKKLEVYSVRCLSNWRPQPVFHSSSSIIHSVSPPSVQEHSSSFSFGSLKPAESSPNLGTSLCMGMCVHLCVYVNAMFWGEEVS